MIKCREVGNRLYRYRARQPEGRRGFREIIVTEPEHPFMNSWWPPGHIMGYEHTFVHLIANFVGAVVTGKSLQPTFEDGLKNQRVPHAGAGKRSSGRWMNLQAFAEKRAMYKYPNPS